MRRPQFSSIFARGFLAIRKSLSLATKGILDQKIGGKPIPSIYDVEFFFNIEGTKVFYVKAYYSIIGVAEKELVGTYNLSGVREVLARHFYDILGVVKYPLKETVAISGLRETNIADRIYSLFGNKEFEIDRKVNVWGAKRFNFGMERDLIASRLCDFHKERNLVGSKIINIDDTLEINGKRDKTPILVALDLIGGGK